MNTHVTVEDALTSEAPERIALAEHMQRAVRGPLAALRTVLEGQRPSHALSDAWPAAPQFGLERALDELAAVESAVNDLWRWTVPAAVRRTRCSLMDVVANLRGGLDDGERKRVWVIVEQGAAALHTDGGLLVSTMRRFVRASLARDTRELLVHAHAEADSATLAIVDDPPDGALAPGAEPPLDLPLMLGRRDIVRLGGTCTVHHTSPRHRCIVLRFPRAEAVA